MKKVIIILVLLTFALIIGGCKVVQVQPEPIEQENQTIALSNLSISEPCPSGTTFLSNFMKGYQCQPTDKIRDCEAGGGSWKLFGNGCGDSCGEKPRLCTQAFAAACDCGTSKCWGTPPACKTDTLTGAQICRVILDTPPPSSCIDDSFEPYATAKEACEATRGNWTYYGGGCRSVPTGEKCGGIAGIICQGDINNPEVGCRFRDSNKTLLPSSLAPYPDAIGECYALVCFSQGVKCVCPSPLTFGLQGCKEYPQETNKLMSVVGGWN